MTAVSVDRPLTRTGARVTPCRSLPPVNTYLAGLVAMAGLIVGIGAQNVFLIRQGARREGIGGVIVICTVADALLVCAGTLGIGVLVERAPLLLQVLKWGGAAYLLWFAYQSFRSARHPRGIDADGAVETAHVYRTALALTWLNPWVYLDTLVLIGSLANQHGPTGRWAFAAGAITSSVVWFVVVGLGARALSAPLSSAKVWRWLDGAIGVIMVGLATKFALS